MALCDRIKEARKKKGLTQEQLGDLIGAAKTTVAGYEKNREPTAAKLGEIADVLEVDVNFLLQDEMKKSVENEKEKLNAQEFGHIQKYRLLSQAGKRAVNNTIDTILEYEKTFNQATASSGNVIDITSRQIRNSGKCRAWPIYRQFRL